jgi:catechol-2,3-dioxygenase
MDQPQTADKTEFSIHPKTGMGHISLTVANLENQIEFYTKAMGFKLHWRDGNKAGWARADLTCFCSPRNPIERNIEA